MSMRTLSLRASVGLASVLLLCLVAACSPSLSAAAAGPVGAIAVSGNQLVNWAGEPVVLRGVDTSGTEYACVSEKSIFDGSEEASPSSIAAMQSWGFNAARVELNESCWLGVQGVKPAYSASAYRAAIEQYVDALNGAGMYVIVDMHFSSTGGARKATGQEPMPDAHYAPAFWSSVAEAFKGNPAVIFDLFNEPYPDRNTDSEAAWRCVRDGSAGGTCSGFHYQAAGMQQLLDAVRATGASNVVMVGGPQYAGDLDDWLQYEPLDPLHQLAASIHIYWKNPAHPEYSPCYDSACWQHVLAPLSAQAPIVVGEFGELDCGDTLYPPLLDFADQHGISYLGWAWFVGSCAREPSLISSYSGTPTAYGVGYRQHLAELGLGPGPSG
ncbi:MAG: glycoside hydrolase family 5 protein [Solirubrobacteraceae bacterium]